MSLFYWIGTMSLAIRYQRHKKKPAVRNGHRPSLVIVGNGMAAVRLVQKLLEFAPEKYDITMIGKEHHASYNRIMLSSILADEKSFDDISLTDPSWETEFNIRLITGQKVITGSLVEKNIILNNGERIFYDQLVLATGSKPFVLPIENALHPDVIPFRTYEDVQKIQQLATRCEKALVIGGGLLGLEAANGLRKQGVDVSVVHAAEFLLNRQLDEKAATLLQKNLEKRGIRFELNAFTNKVTVDPQGRLTGISLTSGRALPAQLVVMAVGVQPNAELGRVLGLQTNRGILINDFMQTSMPSVWAVGECVEHKKEVFGLVAPLYEQADVLAHQLADLNNELAMEKELSEPVSPSIATAFVQKPVATTLKVSEVQLFSAGVLEDTEAENLIFNDPINHIYKRLLIKNDQLIGAVLYGEVQHGNLYFELIQSGQNISTSRSQLMFGKVSQAEGVMT